MISLRLAACTVLLPVALRAQLVCPAGEPASYFGWKSTECGNCSIYGTYIEYLTPPKIRDIDPDGPARGRLQENDVLLGVDGAAILSQEAWQKLRDAKPGQLLKFTVERGRDTAETSVVASTRCAPRSARSAAYVIIIPVTKRKP